MAVQVQVLGRAILEVPVLFPTIKIVPESILPKTFKGKDGVDHELLGVLVSADTPLTGDPFEDFSDALKRHRMVMLVGDRTKEGGP